MSKRQQNLKNKTFLSWKSWKISISCDEKSGVVQCMPVHLKTLFIVQALQARAQSVLLAIRCGDVLGSVQLFKEALNQCSGMGADCLLQKALFEQKSLYGGFRSAF